MANHQHPAPHWISNWIKLTLNVHSSAKSNHWCKTCHSVHLRRPRSCSNRSSSMSDSMSHRQSRQMVCNRANVFLSLERGKHHVPVPVFMINDNDNQFKFPSSRGCGMCLKKLRRQPDGQASRPKTIPKKGTISDLRLDGMAGASMGSKTWIYGQWVWDHMKLRSREKNSPWVESMSMVMVHGLSSISPLRVWLHFSVTSSYIGSVLWWNHWINLAPSLICLLVPELQAFGIAKLVSERSSSKPQIQKVFCCVFKLDAWNVQSTKTAPKTNFKPQTAYNLNSMPTPSRRILRK